MVKADVFEWDVLVKRAKQRKQTGTSQQVYSNPLPKHQVMAFQDEQLLNLLVSKDWVNHVIPEEDWDSQVEHWGIISDDDWDSETDEELTVKELLNQFNLTTVAIPAPSLRIVS